MSGSAWALQIPTPYLTSFDGCGSSVTTSSRMYPAANKALTCHAMYKDAHPDMEHRHYPLFLQEIDQFRMKGFDDILDSIVNILMVCPPLGRANRHDRPNDKKLDRRDFIRTLSNKGKIRPQKQVRRRAGLMQR